MSIKKSEKNNRHKRFLINKYNKLMKKKHSKNKKKKTKPTINNIYYIDNNIHSHNSKIIKVLDKENFKKKTRRKKDQKEVQINIPKIFSFINNPNDTILTLKKIYYAGMNNHIKSIYFNYSQCIELGLCASLITDLIILSLPRYKTKKIFLHGSAPNSVEARKLFNITGLPKHLGIIDESTPDSEILDTLSNLESGEMSERVVEFYQKCLHTQGYELTMLGKNAFSNMIGEVINNSEQYSGSNGTWHALGYFDKPERGEDYGKCRLVLMNFGNSIYDSLKELDTTQYTKNQLETHTKKNYNLFDKMTYTEEMLWTLYSLQQNISKKRKDVNDDRGNGTIKLIKNFMSVGAKIENKKSLMSITSGKCQILFDGSYELEEKSNNGKKYYQIAFNNENDLNKKPDKKCVYNLQNKFPGTIISMEIYLDRKYFDQLLNKEDK